jgi:hypothetical protein
MADSLQPYIPHYLSYNLTFVVEAFKPSIKQHIKKNEYCSITLNLNTKNWVNYFRNNKRLVHNIKFSLLIPQTFQSCSQMIHLT